MLGVCNVKYGLSPVWEPPRKKGALCEVCTVYKRNSVGAWPEARREEREEMVAKKTAV